MSQQVDKGLNLNCCGMYMCINLDVSSAYDVYGSVYVFFFNDTATTDIYTLSLHDALPIYNVPFFICDVVVG